MQKNERSITGSTINLRGYLTVVTAVLKSEGKSFINCSLNNSMESHLLETIFTPLSSPAGPDHRPSGEKKSLANPIQGHLFPELTANTAARLWNGSLEPNKPENLDTALCVNAEKTFSHRKANS